MSNIDGKFKAAEFIGFNCFTLLIIAITILSSGTSCKKMSINYPLVNRCEEADRYCNIVKDLEGKLMRGEFENSVERIDLETKLEHYRAKCAIETENCNRKENEITIKFRKQKKGEN